MFKMSKSASTKGLDRKVSFQKSKDKDKESHSNSVVLAEVKERPSSTKESKDKFFSQSSKKFLPEQLTLTDYFENSELNPYKVVRDEDIFMFREREQYQKELDKERQKKLKATEKTTYSRRINSKPVMFFDKDIGTLKKECNYAQGQDDYNFVLKITKDQSIEKETLDEYIRKKREMFLLNYSIGVKKEEMNKLERLTLAEEKKLELAEQYLEEDALMFDEFLKENDKTAGDAIKLADSEKKLKQEKDNELRALNTQIMMVKGEITKYEEQLKEYNIYKNFLLSLTPNEWIEQKKQELQEAKKEAGKEDDDNDEDDGDDDDDEPLLYFTDPQQLLDIFGELEEQNLSLIQNSQETEEALEEMKQTFQSTKEKMEEETNSLREQIEFLKSSIDKEGEEASNLAAKALLFSVDDVRSDDQAILAKLNKVVEEAYKTCIGEAETSLTTLQMLTAIENKLEDLFQQIELMPKNKFEAAVKAKEKERRLKHREEKIHLQRVHQEERMKKAMERANAEPKKKYGRKLMTRSEPPQVKKSYKADKELESREEEEQAYYFMP